MLAFWKIEVCVLILTAAGNAVFGQTGTHDGFELVRDEDSIRVFERWVTFPKSHPPVTAREVKSEFFISTTIADALALIRDQERVPLWQSHVSEFRVYPDSDSLWYEYSYHDIPWPVSDQDHYLQYAIRDPVESDGLFITFETLRNKKRAPLRKGVSRMTLSGSWYFQKIAPGRIKVTYRILSMPGSLPRIITDPVIRSNLMRTVRAYIDILESGG